MYLLVGFEVFNTTKLILNPSYIFFFLSAKAVVELAKSRLIQVAVLLHPSFITVDDISGMNFHCYKFFSNLAHSLFRECCIASSKGKKTIELCCSFL